jgi:hypothetical protein
MKKDAQENTREITCGDLMITSIAQSVPPKKRCMYVYADSAAPSFSRRLMSFLSSSSSRVCHHLCHVQCPPLRRGDASESEPRWRRGCRSAADPPWWKYAAEEEEILLRLLADRAASFTPMSNCRSRAFQPRQHRCRCEVIALLKTRPHAIHACSRAVVAIPTTLHAGPRASRR